MAHAAVPDDSGATVLEIERLVRHFERGLRDLRILLGEVRQAHGDTGVLGSRGLTQFCLDQLKQRPDGSGMKIVELLSAAERAGYAVPTAKMLTKRLVQHGHRTGLVAYSADKLGWYYRGEQ